MVTATQVKAAFLALPPDRKLRVLSLLAHNITIGARAVYPGQVEERVAADKLRAFNELGHTVTSKLMTLIAVKQQGFPDEGLLETLFEKAQRGACEKDLIEAFQWSCAAQL
jgi:hypothetical protein